MSQHIHIKKLAVLLAACSIQLLSSAGTHADSSPPSADTEGSIYKKKVSTRVRESESSLSKISKSKASIAGQGAVYTRKANRRNDKGGVLKTHVQAYEKADGTEGLRTKHGGRTAEGEYWRQVNKQRHNKNGGTVNKTRQRSYSEAEGLSYSKNVSREGANGKSYEGSATLQDGKIIREHNCKDEQGLEIGCK
ncbi:hypothetical protein [uncultured Pseudoteredinibacter sp.]|uniref:hypothetical protein n=1 Tax=uncultured Pseudoteredinibacter sp. TaxID=1641701 RepID=UPI002636FE7C|nr:hypothetical protein [uncultured Pseudoteredinibacter sp.]